LLQSPDVDERVELSVDRSLYRRINDFADSTAWAHGIVRAGAKYGIVILGVLLLAAWWQARRQADVAVAAVVWAGAAPLAALAVAQVVNKIVDRSRPYVAMPDAHVLIARSADASFPSDHSTAAGAVAVGLVIAGAALGSRRLGIIAAVAAVLLAFSRVYVGVHYPSDVLAGLAIGGVVAVVFAPLAKRLLTPIARRVATTPLAWLVTTRSTN
jgi:undecaprenyl-diphosphatase